jgi:hypothetical protein
MTAWAICWAIVGVVCPLDADFHGSEIPSHFWWLEPVIPSSPVQMV